MTGVSNQNTKPVCWRHFRQFCCGELTGFERDWLLNRDSLTQRLIRASDGAFRVQLLGQYWGFPSRDEAQALGMKLRQRALIREVVLHGRNEPWVYARSLLPAKSLGGSLGYLKRLGTKPLGALLFSRPDMRRGPIELACLSPQQLPIDVAEPVWGRRSVFYLADQPLLVSEIFLPTFNPVS